MAMSLRPFFPYFGSKWRCAPYYPAPEQDLIIEPFAGSAGYSLRYPDRQVLLIDRDPVIIGVWQYLIAVEPEEVLRIPDVREHIDEIADWPQEARWLVGFWLHKGNAKPALTPSAWCRDSRHHARFWGAEIRERIARQVSSIRHWRAQVGRHETAPAVSATWFIDPPYNNSAGRRYRDAHRGLDYRAIGDWTRSRRGLVIACEQAGADWLPFWSFRRIKANHKTAWSDEVVWIRRDRQEQLPLFVEAA